MMKTVAVTGATSMIGAALIEECVRNGIRVIAFVRKNSTKLDRLPDSPLIQIVEAELDELGAVGPPKKSSVALEDTADTVADLKNANQSSSSEMKLHADVFYHLGWATGHANRGNVRLQADNIRYTLDAVDLAERLGCSRFIGAGSQAEYGPVDEILTADTITRPVIPYGIAKLAAGNLSRIACEQKGIEHIWVRVLSIYGTWDKPNTLISQLVQHAIHDEPMELSGCEQTWDYLFETDAGRAFLETGRSGIPGKTYVLGSGEGRRLRSYVDEVTEMVSSQYHPGQEPYQPEFGKRPYGNTQPMHLVADIAELTEDTGWKPLVSFAEGVREMLKKAGN